MLAKLTCITHKHFLIYFHIHLLHAQMHLNLQSILKMHFYMNMQVHVAEYLCQSGHSCQSYQKNVDVALSSVLSTLDLNALHYFISLVVISTNWSTQPPLRIEIYSLTPPVSLPLEQYSDRICHVNTSLPSICIHEHNTLQMMCKLVLK